MWLLLLFTLLSSYKTIKKKPAIDAVTATINTTVEEMREHMYQNSAQAGQHTQGGAQAGEDIRIQISKR